MLGVELLLFCYLRLLFQTVSAAIDIETVPFKNPLEKWEVFVISVLFYKKKVKQLDRFF